MTPRANSLSERVYVQLKRRINLLEILPGSLLGEVRLAHTFQTSRTPVREALHRLYAEGLVDVFPRQGAVVSGTSLSEIVDAYEVRELLEPLAAVRAAQRGLDPKSVQRLVTRLQALNDVEPLSPSDVRERVSVDRDLHALIVSVSGNELLAKITEDMHSRVRRVFVLIGKGGRFRTSREEHLEILRAIREGKADQAAELMRQHLRSSKEWLLGHGILHGSGEGRGSRGT